MILPYFGFHGAGVLMEIELLKSEQKFRKIFEDSMDGLILWNNQLQIVDINYSAQRIFGLSKGRMIGQSLLDLFNTVDEKKQQEFLNHIKQVTDIDRQCSSMAIKMIDGKVRHFDYSTTRGIIDGLNLTVIIDVTEKAEMQEQLRKSDRLNLIGELAAGIAHEIRNPMTALKGFIQLLEPSIKAQHSMYYDVITSELARMDSIINEFLILAKPQETKFQEKDICQIMRETVELLSPQAVLYNVQFHTHYEDQLPYVYCEPNQLKKVFINLIKNAIEVMPNGGEITIAINSIKDQYIVISIRDEGTGIPKDKIKKLGEPFYTTKEKGTGLGLMVSYRIIEEHNGSMEVESEEGIGTLFKIRIPLNHLTKK
ncbi:two-component system, sporulation sensor kinase E [Neobacillus niacini]|uniref:PAS domain-containing sensor histidine kinase n=1 Tax=Neobacillus niacini TaxID=86668 RepID=UPI002789B374|nr:ATP-binding protein [Neobacillus niacini]MDQ1004001.1 two-component system, sporulation sensor kinase E [Neobacillus niacini]